LWWSGEKRLMMHAVIEQVTGFIANIGVLGTLIGAVGALAILSLVLSIRGRWNPYRRAVKYYQKGHPARAHTLLRFVLDKSPTDRRALLLKSDIEAETGKFADAEKGYHRLLDLKQPGDGIDPFQVRVKLLKPLYRGQKLLEVFELCTRILSIEKSNPEALYHLGLVYLGQLYYPEAARVLSVLLKNRPRFTDARFAAAVTDVQLRDLDAAERHIRMVLAEEERPLPMLVLASIHFYRENYPACLSVLESMKGVKKSLERKDRNRYHLRLEGLCRCLNGDHEKAVERFRELYQELRSEPGSGVSLSEELGSGSGKPAARKTAAGKNSQRLYNEFGRIGTPAAPEADEEESGGSGTGAVSPTIRDYYRLKEVVREEGKHDRSARGALTSSDALLDVEGLTEATWCGLSLVFSLIGAGNPQEALQRVNELRMEHPEVLGLGKIVRLVEEAVREKSEKEVEAGGAFSVERSTRKITHEKKRRFELREYRDAWAKELIRPYQLVQMCGFASKKRLNHGLLFGNGGPIELIFGTTAARKVGDPDRGSIRKR
jgi:tetratricopeptide (TPR) repeat protein